MSLEEYKAIVRKMFEPENKRNLALLDELVAPDYFDHGLQRRGRESVKQFITMLFNAFPDWHETVEDIIAEGEKVWIRFKATGTHTGEYRGPGPSYEKMTLAPTGKKASFMAVSIYRVVDSKIVERESVYDMLDFFKQLGIIEFTEKGKKLFPENDR